MKAAALQALQHVRTTLAYQLTPEAVSELLEPIQEALALYPDLAAHDAKVERALQMIESDDSVLYATAADAIRSLRL